MKSIPIIFLSILLAANLGALCQQQVRLQSPDGRLVFALMLKNNEPYYTLNYKGLQLLAASKLGLSFTDGSFSEKVRLGKPVFTEARVTYSLIVGKTKQVADQYRELRIPLFEPAGHQRRLELVVRAFNDGLAFRYEIPQQAGWTALSISDEQTEFHLTGNPTIYTLQLPNYRSSHEGEYTVCPWKDLRPDTLMDMPTLVEFPENIYLGITEAALKDFAGMYLMKDRDALKAKLSPRLDMPGLKVMGTLPHCSPWRVLLVSDRVGSLIESNIITDLNDDPAPIDWSWIRPGKTTFPWWNGNVLPDSINAPGNNFVTQQYYIDFCARSGIEYHSVVEYGLHQWYMDDGISFQPGPHADVTTPVPGLDMKAVCDYAKSKGVGIRVWVHFYALYPKLDTAFALFEKWGISGMMVDFMDRDDQQMVNMQNEILAKAAAHHLHIQFHGAYKNTGMHRTFPNEFTREGTLNYESNKWSKRVNPDHDINFPFTRMLAGSTDYHLGGFRAVTDSAFLIQYTRPLIIGTRCHMLAMYVVLENYLGMVCDYPAAYEGQSGFEFLQQVPTTWDQTRVLDARPGQYILIARKKGLDWYLGAITNHSSRELTVDFAFLDDSRYQATVFADSPDADREPNHLSKTLQTVGKDSRLRLLLAGGGGFVIRLTRLP